MSRRRQREFGSVPAPDDPHSLETDGRCPFCGRPIPAGARASRHHLTPKLKGGARLGTVRLHQICHSTIHARFSEAEIARRLSDIEALRSEPAFADFLTWISNKPDDFHAPTTSLRRKRRTALRR